MAAALMNPSQAAHLRAIRETAELKARDSFLVDAFLPLAEYHNYFLFSITSFKGKVFTYGYLGRVQTRDEVRFFYEVK